MLNPKQRETLIGAIALSPYRCLQLGEAAQRLSFPLHLLQSHLQQDQVLENHLQKTLKGSQKVVRLKWSGDHVLRLLPVKQGLLEGLYGEQVVSGWLKEKVASGEVHLRDDVIHPGLANSQGNKNVSEGPTYPVVFNSEDAAIHPDEVLVLGMLEDIEARRINFGLYETFTPVEEIAAGLPEHFRSRVEEVLSELVRKKQVLRLEDQYRSRISELVRLLKQVKQRFRKGDSHQAPQLVQGLQVYFQDRKRLKREEDFSEVLQGLLRIHSDPSTLRAVKVLEKAFAAALGQEEGAVKVTSVQKQALLHLGSQYLKAEGGGAVITGNTGSGKTEAVLLPLLLGVLQEKFRDTGRGVKAILVYPRQNLAKNQLARLCEYVAHINLELEALRGHGASPLSVGMVFGNTPLDGQEIHKSKYGRHWKPVGVQQYELPYFTSHDDGPVLAHPVSGGNFALESGGGFHKGGWSLRTFKATRQSIQQDPPDILVITTEMLHRWLMDPAAHAVFGLKDPQKPLRFTPPRAVVMDEIHLYSGIHGAQIAGLMRRLYHRLQEAMVSGGASGGWNSPLMVGMSATIGNPQGFWEMLSGVEGVVPLVPVEKDFQQAQGRDYFLFIRPETYSKGRFIGDASVAIQTIMTITHNMVRRGPQRDGPPRHRSLIFQDSISKLKKLTLEFWDAESKQGLSQLRLNRPDHEVFSSHAFKDGEYWFFEAEDPWQHNEKRSAPLQPPTVLTSANHPVFSGGGQDVQVLKRDIIFATSSLEVGYDDPSIQFVLQHHAPSNVASFIQKKGRAGRSLDDRPITAITLSRNSYRDAYYYQNPHLLVDPADHHPPLNPDNDFVQRFHVVALIFDELSRVKHWEYRTHREASSLKDHLQVLKVVLEEPQVRNALERAYPRLVSGALRSQPFFGNWQTVWAWFVERLQDPEVQDRYQPGMDLLQLCPDIPENLFSSINLPVVQVMHAERNDEWQFHQEDVALTFSEFTPGRVSRRYGRHHQLLWRPPLIKVGGKTLQNKVALERYKPRSGKPGPFRPDLVKDLSMERSQELIRYMPESVGQLYPQETPSRFYRLRYLELWDFGQMNTEDPRSRGKDWHWWGRKNKDGTVRLRYQVQGVTDEALYSQGFRLVSPESSSYPLSFTATFPVAGHVASKVVPLPPLFGGLFPSLEYFCEQVEGRRSRLSAWEVQYGAEASLILMRKDPRNEDPLAGRGHNLVQYVSEQDGAPMLYGYDLVTEGIRVLYSPSVLQEVSQKLAEDFWANPLLRTQLQDQFLRYLLKHKAWAVGVEEGLNMFQQRTMADVLCTMRAESRAREWTVQQFLEKVHDQDGLQELFGLARIYWQDHRTLHQDFQDQASRTLQNPQAVKYIREAFQTVQKKAKVCAYIQDTLLHSMKHAVRNMFLIHGSTDEMQVGSGMQLQLVHGHRPDDHAFYVYERNQDGAGSTRVAARWMEGLSKEEREQEWYRFTLECPVGDEEGHLRKLLNPQHCAGLLQAVHHFMDVPAHLRTQRHVEELKSHLGLPMNGVSLERVFGTLTAETSVWGERFRQIDLMRELMEVETQVFRRFQRRPLPQEVAGFAYHLLQDEALSFPALKRLLNLYQKHAQGLEDEDEEVTVLDRFLAQLEHLSPSTCLDGCPACLNSHCDLGHVEVTRHLVSRQVVRMAHMHLRAQGP